jgi:hypothetical protein
MVASRRDVVAKYLERYAEPEAVIGTRLNRSTQHIVVIPAQDESSTFFNGIQPALSNVIVQGDRALCIVVVNATDAQDAEIHARNQSLVDALKAKAAAVPIHAQGETPCWYGQEERFDLVVLDRNREGHRLPRHEGVGLARKIGCDFALAAIHKGASDARLIHMTDCDVRLPKDYFEATIQPSSAALIYQFIHEPCGEALIDEAHARYEAYLRYYTLGLRYAGSPYGFHTIGSCIAIEPITYAGVRGVPKRQAGEDFYLLNKLAKLGRIETATSSPIVIRARNSQRVPFGTGRATHDIAKNVGAYRIYDPRIFDLLKAWLSALPAIEGVPPNRAYDTVCRQAGMQLATRDRDRLNRTLVAINAPKALRQAAAQSIAIKVRKKWLNDWFDAFRTLKFVHALRDEGFVDVAWRQGISDASFCRPSAMGNSGDDTTEGSSFELCRGLARLEE